MNTSPRSIIENGIVAPFLLIIYIAVFQLSRNANQGIQAREVISVTGALLAAILASLIIFKLISRRRMSTAAFAMLLLWGLLVMYGPIQALLQDWLWGSDRFFTIARHRGLLPIFAIAMAVVFVWLSRSSGDFRSALKISSGVLVVLIGINTITYFNNRTAISVPENFPPPAGIPVIDSGFVPNNRPDIYYILLDGYGRNDVLIDTAGFDNREFLDRLSDHGFSISEDATTNYNFTTFSLPSALNMAYIEPEDVRLPYWRDQQNRIFDIEPLIQRATAGKLAVQMGYEVRGINASTSQLRKDAFPLFGPFSTLFRDLTPFKIDIGQINYFWVRQLKGRDLAVNMSRLLSVIDNPEPTLAFLYVGAPHPPYFYDSAGKFLIGAGTKQQGWLPASKYIGQLEYVNSLVDDLINTIIQDSDEDPVIIITSDHGPHFQEPEAADQYRYTDEIVAMQAGILVAARPSSTCPINLPDDVTQVNVLRRVFNACWGTSFEDLPNKLYVIPGDRSQDLYLVVE